MSPAHFPDSSPSRNPARAKSPFKVASKPGIGDRKSGPRDNRGKSGVRGGGRLCVNK